MRTALLPLAALPLLLTACLLGGGGGGASPAATTTASSTSTSTTTPSTTPVSIQFALKSGTNSVSCGTAISSLGTSAVSADLKDARFYVHDVKLITAQGNAVPVKLTQDSQWQYLDTALLDFENATGTCAAAGTAATNNLVQGSIDSGNYVGMSFQVGVPSTATNGSGNTVGMNHLPYATAPAPLNISAMAWSWQVGRKFMKVEFNPVGGVARPTTPPSTSTTFNIHLGSTNCTGGDSVTGLGVTCSNPNRLPVKFAAFNPSSQQVVLDVQQLLASSNLSQDTGGAVGCMSGTTDPECPAIFDKLDLNLATSPAGQAKGDGSNVPAFRVESK
ncbi:metallo-mystery pair system four-Cys motif protein [Vogesella sp. DC21W]|uniref:Metallo-mystery pair system four-Cys motif protein n=1 Tax=Vogesella aquatica TaxID=2984206 RepID=A0ABT5IT51_9NEIS|nr:MbnP family copper-binding protein [Vogesella aquatica]MDC7715755.1 metallo-mystery pair system four-Cys motif protein [Vogesella aquatica]